MTKACGVCEVEFEAKHPSAKYCSDRCRQHSRRGTKGTSKRRNLVKAVEADLERAGVVDTYAGQLALELARLITAPGATGLSSLSKELRTVMATALGSSPRPAVDENSDTGEPDIVG